MWIVRSKYSDTSCRGRMKPPINDQQARFRELLRIERQNILYSAKGKAEPGSDQSQNIDSEREQTIALGAREKEHLREIQRAIERLDSGEYGTCQSCGKKISLARLEARPISLFCFSCKIVEELRTPLPTKHEQHDSACWEPETPRRPEQRMK